MRRTAGAVLLALALGASADGRRERDLGALVRGAMHGDASAVASLEAAALGGLLGAELALGRLRLDGIGVARDARDAFGWLCLAAHHHDVSEGGVHATWMLAEWFRTGGGIADRQYRGASLEREDPVRAYFWYAVLEGMGRRDAEQGETAVRLGAIGKGSVGRMLYDAEREAMGAAATAWQPWLRPADGEACLRLPD